MKSGFFYPTLEALRRRCDQCMRNAKNLEQLYAPSENILRCPRARLQSPRKKDTSCGVFRLVLFPQESPYIFYTFLINIRLLCLSFCCVPASFKTIKMACYL